MMTRRYLTCLGVLLAGVVLMWALPTVSAEDLGKMRVQRMNGTWLVGEVEELANTYRIKTGRGITVTLKKSEVKAILPFAEERVENASPGESAESYSFRRRVADEEIEELLVGITIKSEDIVASSEDLEEGLEFDEDSVEDMCRLAGVPNDDDHVLKKPHFVLVYTTTKTEALKLASRLEAVYRHNLNFMRMIDVPLVAPESKLEIFYFATQKEFQAYATNVGSGSVAGVLGFYRPDANRSAFFDLETFPPAARWLEMAKDTRRPYKERQFARNSIGRWVKHNNIEVIQHEAGHHIHFNIGLFPRDLWVGLEYENLDLLPRWLVEGTTMMFEFPPTKAGASLGTVNHGRLHQCRKYYGSHRFSPQEVKSFVLDNAIFLRCGGACYPIAWSLVNYFWHENREGYCRYMQTIASREPGMEVSYTEREKEFEDCFGRVDEEWVEAWYDYVDDLHLKRSVLPPDLP